MQAIARSGFVFGAGLNGSKITQFADGTLLPGFRAGVAVDLQSGRAVNQTYSAFSK